MHNCNTCPPFLFVLFIAYRQPFAAIPSEACAGKDTVNLTCEILLTLNGGEPQLRSAVMTRNGVLIDQDIPHHMLLTSRFDVIGVTISNITIEDRGVEYTCDDTNAPSTFGSSLTLNVTGMCMCVRTYIHTYMIYVCIHKCIHVCMHLCTYVRTYLCMYH